jgi:[ribosomal protein S18]-alanine N-acetyltransferase
MPCFPPPAILGHRKRSKVSHVHEAVNNSVKQEVLRRASVNDVDALMRIELVSYSEPFTREIFLDYLNSPSSICVVAERDNQILGYALAAVNLQLSQLLSIAVLPEYRSTGVAQRLLAGVMDYCRSSGAQNIRLEVRSANYPARKLYQNMGFSLIGLRNKYYGDDDALVMRADLQLG